MIVRHRTVVRTDELVVLNVTTVEAVLLADNNRHLPGICRGRCTISRTPRVFTSRTQAHTLFLVVLGLAIDSGFAAKFSPWFAGPS